MNKTVNIGEVTVFDNPEPTKEQALKILEEAAEVVEAFKEWDKEYNNLSHPESKLKDEIADVIQSCANLIAALGLGDFTSRMEVCKRRNIYRGRITVEEPEPELKPCPFCGSEVFFTKNDIKDVYYVCCDDIACEMHPETDYCKTKSEAAKIRNTRAGEE